MVDLGEESGGVPPGVRAGVSLNRHLNWGGVWDLLGLPGDLVGLPDDLPCPLCGGGLGADLDRVFGGAWFRCSGCGFAGDLLELVAELRGTSIAGALGEVAKYCRPAPRDINSAAIEHERFFVTPRKRALACFSHSISPRMRGVSSEIVAKLRDSIGFRNVYASDDDWRRRGGAFAGAAEGEAAAELLAIAPPRDRDYGSQSWRGFLTFPAWDLPGRLRGFYDLGRDGDPLRDVRYRPVVAAACEMTASSGGRVRYREPGLAMLPAALLPPDPALGDALFACGDVVAAVRLQLRHLADRTTPLPLVGWTPIGRRRPDRCWESIRRRPVVAFGPDPAEAIRAARLADGLVVDRPDAWAAARDPKAEPAALLAWMLEVAVPWREALGRLLATAPAREAGAALEALAAPRSDLAALLPHLGGVAADRVRGAIRELPHRRALATRTAPIVEADGAWSAAGTRRAKHYSNFILRIDRVVRLRPHAASVYEGRALAGGAEVPFRAVAGRRPGDVGRAVREAVRAAGVLDPLRFASRKAADVGLVELAALFQPPERAEVEAAVGWSREASRFVYPRFSILLGGRVEPSALDLAAVDPNCPGAGFGDFRELDLAEAAALSEPTAEVRTFWAAAAHVAARLVAAALGRRHPPAILMGPGSYAAARAVIACGCHNPLARPKYAHRHPALVRAARSWMRLEAARPRGAILVNHLAGALPAFLQGGWDATIVRDGPEAEALAGPPPPAVPAYLRDLASRRLSLPPGGGLGSRVVADMAGWFGRCGGDPAAVLGAGRDTAWAAEGGERGAAVALAAIDGLAASPLAKDEVAATLRSRDLLEALGCRPQRHASVREGLHRLFRDAGIEAGRAPGGGVGDAGWTIPRARFEALVAADFRKKGD